LSDGASLFSHFVSTRVTFRWLTGLVIVSAAVLWLGVGVDIAEIRLLGREGVGAEPADERAAQGIVAQWTFALRAAALSVTSVAFVVWLYRCRVNLRAFGARRLRYSRNWVVVGFLIPVLNLVRPYQVAREVWQASDPSNTDPFAWTEVRTPRLIQAWWATVVGFMLSKPVAMWMLSSSAYDIARLQIAQAVDLLADGLAAVSVTLLYFVVERITDAQDTKWRSLAPPLPN